MPELTSVPMGNNDCIFWTKDNIEYCLTLEQIDVNPRRDEPEDKLGTMACWHARYNIGDEIDDPTPTDFWNNLAARVLPEKVLQAKKKHYSKKYNIIFYDELPIALAKEAVEDVTAYLPVYLYDHSGLCLSNYSSDEWDSGQIGWFVMDKATALNELDCNEKTWRETAIKYMESKLKTYNDYLAGHCYEAILLSRPVGTADDTAWEPCDHMLPFYGIDILKNGISMIGYGLYDALMAGTVRTGHRRAITTIAYEKD